MTPKEYSDNFAKEQAAHLASEIEQRIQAGCDRCGAAVIIDGEIDDQAHVCQEVEATVLCGKCSKNLDIPLSGPMMTDEDYLEEMRRTFRLCNEPRMRLVAALAEESLYGKQLAEPNQRRWVKKLSAHGEDRAIDRFLWEIIEVCRRHGLAIGHEDTHGAFEIYDLKSNPDALKWLKDARDGR
jgi:hypothetical protein